MLLRINILIFTLILVFGRTYAQIVTYCKKKDGLKVQCFNEQTSSITDGGTVTKNQKILVKINKDGADCDSQIPEYRLVVIPPGPTGDTKEDTKDGIVFTTDDFTVPPYTITEVGRVTFKFFPCYRYENECSELLTDPKSCKFNVDYAKPKAILAGGSEGVYKPTTEVVIDASNSENPNEKVNKAKDLTFSWKCAVVEGKSSKSCSDNKMKEFQGKSKIILPADEAREGSVYKVTVTVKLKNVDNPENYIGSTSQRVRFSATAASLTIWCNKNCAPKTKRTLSSIAVILEAICTSCKLSSNVYDFWTIKDSNNVESVDYKKLKDPSRKGKSFYLNPVALKDDEIYTVTVEKRGDSTVNLIAEFILNTKLPPPLKDCSIDPPTGTAFKTGFQAKCTYFKEDNTFEVYSLKDGKTVLLFKAPTIEEQVFYLPAGASVIINMTDNQSGYTQTVNVNVDVKQVLNLDNKASDEEKSKAVNNMLDDVLEIADDGEPEFALQGVSAVVGEYSNMPADKRDMELKMDHKAVSVINSINIDSPQRAQQAVDLLAQITEKYDENPDPELSLKSSELCNKASRILEAQAQSMENPDMKRPQLTNNMKSLSSCSQAGLGKNIESVKPKPHLINLPTTQFPLLQLEKIDEQYDDYSDDEKSAENIARFEKASESMKKICFSNAKMLAQTMVPEEDPLITIQGSISTASAVRYCEDLSETTVNNSLVTLVPPRDCQKFPVIDILMCVVDKNPYWWKDNIPLVTKVAYVNFEKSKYVQEIKHLSALDEDPPDDTEELGGFVDPFTISFEKLENVTTEVTVHEASLPTKSLSDTDTDNFYEVISTHRIYVFNNRGFTVSFKNMTKEHYFDVVVTNFEKPSYAYFKTHFKTISADNSEIDINISQNYDSFWYISLLPNKKMVDSNLADKKYFFSVTTAACYTWNETVKAWVFACSAANGLSSTSTITCRCTRGIIFTGYITNNKVNLVENIIIHFQLKLQRCWIVFITTMVTFFLFCILLLYTSLEKKDNILDRVFFVPDVPSYFHYAYIIVVKTGKKRHSGTTSNVTVKLYGTKGNSLEHVLNYPDPEMAMLQRNAETWFVIATEKELGDLEKIDVWFDAVGNNAKWYGSQIEIYDVQQNDSWQFEVENWLDIMQDERHALIVTPKKQIKTDIDQKTRTQVVLKAVQSFMGKTAAETNLWNLSIKDPLLISKERVSIIFSTLMTMFLVIMMLYRIPSFDESDSIDENNFGFHGTLIWTPIVGSLTAFIIHFPVIYFVKRSKIKSTKRKLSIASFEFEFISTICWIIVTFLSTICITLLIICGFWVPTESSLLWLVSVILGIFFNALVLQNILSILYGYFLKLPLQVESFAKTTQRIIEFVNLQRAWLYKRFGSLSLRPYFQHLYYRLDFITLRERLKLVKTKIQTVQILEDLVMIVIYVTLLYLVLLMDKEPMAVFSHKAVKNLAKGKLIKPNVKVHTLSDLEDFLNETFIPSIQSLQWYGKFIQDNPGMTKDFSNKYLGIIRIRQHRTKELPCRVPEIMKFLNMTCRPDFRQQKEFGAFSRKWEPLSELTNITTERMANIWKYSSASFTGTDAYFGEFNIYPGGGYVSLLGRTIKNSKINLDYILKHKWLDLRTRAILIEFLTYNPNVNLFNTVQVVFEMSSAGHIETNIEIQTRKLLMVDHDNIFTVTIINVCFALILLGLFIRIIYKILKLRFDFFYDVWSLFDVIIVILSLVSIYLYYARMGRVKIYVNNLSAARNNEFVNYFYLFTADNILTSLTAILVFIATFRLWKLLKFMVIVQIAEKTIKDSAIPLLVCFLYQMVYMVAFSICGTLFFGSDTKDFRNFRFSLTTLTRLSIGLFPDFNMDALQNHPLGVPYYVLYMMFSLFFVTTYIAIITLYYADAKDFFADESGFVSKFVREKWIYYKTVLNVRLKNLRGGEDAPTEERIIKPKLGERYENAFTICKSRIRAMALVTMCVLRNEKENTKMTDKDFDLITKTIKTLFEKECHEKDIFFRTGALHNIKLIADSKIEQIADICERLAQSQNIIRVSRKMDKTLIEERIQRMDALIENVNTISSILNNIEIRTK